MCLPRTLALLAALCLGGLSAFAQTPRVYLKFDGNLNDSSGSNIITSVVPSSGFTPTYATDRNGQPNRALVLPGSASLQLLDSTLPNDSNQALGLRTASGSNTSFTLTAWVRFSGVGSGQGYNTVFGNIGSGTGTLHAGLGNDTDKAHFGFDNGNDANGSTGALVPNEWFHLAFVYDATTQTQRIFINGIPEVTRTAVTNTLKASDLLLGNWGAAVDASNDMRGQLDEVAVFNTALSSDQVQALFNGVEATSLPAAGTYSAPKLPGAVSIAGQWSVLEIKNYPGIPYESLLNADRIIRAYATTPAGTVASHQASVINFADDENAGNPGYFTNEGDFATNTPADDNNLLMLARCAVRIPVEDDYTFGFRGDEGSRLRVIGQQFKYSTRVNTANPADPAHHGDGLYYTAGTLDSNTLGVVHLKPGDYNLELVWWEGTGSASIEVFAARGFKTGFDGTFQLVGNTALGGLEIVRDPDTVPAFTVNNQSSLFVHNGSPANFTLAWNVNDPSTTLSIDQGIGAVTRTGSQIIPIPAQTTTYTLTAQSGPDTLTRSVTVYVNSPPVVTFQADNTLVPPGTSVQLSWQADGATSLTLQPDGVDVLGQTTRTVNPTTDTTYTLVATNPSGTTQKQVTVKMGLPPTINSFTVSDPNTLYGVENSLIWDVSNATSLSINQGIGTVSGPTGSVQIAPLQTTVYTLSASNGFGTSTKTITVTQPSPIGVASPGFSARRVNATTPFPFAGQGYLQSAESLLAGQNAGTSVTQNNIQNINFTDGADGDFPSGNQSFPGGSGDNFAVKFTGTLVVNTPGEYTFVVNCDDGARLRIDGKDVIVDDGTHSPGGNSGKVTLTKRTAQIELIYYDATGSGEVELGWIRPNLTWQLLSVITPAAPIVRGQVLISEFMAENKSTLLDEDNESSDWIEIWNSTTAPADLAGYYLTDDPAVLNKWAFPAKTISANEYLVVFASAKNRRDPTKNLHTNFKLSSFGSYLALTKDNGAGGFTIVSEFAPTYPPQKSDVSYGSSDSEGYIGYMEIPTPGQPNGATVTGFVKDTKFSHPRGRYSAPFSLTISTDTPGAVIRYTTNGSTPTLNKGTIYTGPITVSKTTVVRAAAFKPGWKPTNVDTQTYMFVDDIATQTATTAVGAGFPSSPINGQAFRYGMNLANVSSAGGNLQSLKTALTSAPTVCMTTDMSNLVDPTSGIYVNPGQHGLFWERPASLEYINTTGTSEFQINCGVRIRGGFSRSTSNPKHAFHLFFRNLYDGGLKYRLFGTSGASEFSQIDMRCEQNYSWGFQNDSLNALIREEWARTTQGDMGQPYSRTGYFHLYINGIYWGVFNWEERTEASFGETYLGGQKDDVDVVKSSGSSGSYNTEMTDGNFAAWKSLCDQCVALKNDSTETGRTTKYMKMRGLNPDGTRNPSYPVLLDVDNLIDYNLVTFYDGSFDSPLSTFLNNASNNWFGVRDRLGSRGFAFFSHDQEHGMGTSTNSYNRVGPWGGSGTNNWGQAEYGSRDQFAKSNPQYMHEQLAYSAEYRQRFADRVQKHFFNNGALTQAKAVARANALATQVDAIIHAEAARWGSTSLNRNSWLSAKNGVLSFLNTGGAPAGSVTWPSQPRTTLIIEQLRGYTDVGAKPLFPPATLSAPTFSGQFGGAVSNPYSFNITNPNASGTIYYTVNGGDPRSIGGAVSPTALTATSPIPITLNSTATVRARIYNSTTQQWSALVEAQYLVGSLASAANLVISKIHYNPPSADDLQEFVEVMNIGNQTIDLTNVQFTLGIQFQFADGATLAPGARALIVRDATAFASAYPNVPANLIAGTFANGTTLDNSGERLQLLDANGAVIRDFSYSDSAPWPTSPDGEGPCLVLIRPETNPDHGVATNWRASSVTGGTPGSSDALAYSAWATANGISDAQGTADPDGDGISNLYEYALGTNPNQPSGALGRPTLGVQTLSVNGVISDYLTLSFRRPLGRDDVNYQVEGSSDFSAWNAGVVVGSATYNGDGTETVTWRYPQPKSAQTQQFLHLKVTRQQ